MSLRDLLLAGACALALAACGNNGEDQADEAGESALAEVPSPEEMPNAAEQAYQQRVAEGLAESEAYLAENGARNGVTTLESGLQVEVLEAGEGQSPAESDHVTLHYVGKHMDGAVFDSSVEREEPVTESLQAFMPGLKEGILQMKQGGKARVTIPPQLAFGPAGTPDGTIGPNEALVFDIQLLEVIDADDTERLQEIEQEAMARAEARFEELASANATRAQEYLAENGAREDIKTTESGLQYQVLETGEGDASPNARDVVEVHYRGTLIDGTEFDSSYARGETAEFPLRAVISGWTEGLQLMEEGDKFRFFIPPALAYGENGKGPIGPNELLIFDVELIDVKQPVALNPDEAGAEE